MFFNKKYTIFLPLLYFGFALCFHKNIQPKCNFCWNSFPAFSSDCASGFLRKLEETILPDISQGEPFSDITLYPNNLTSPTIITHSTDMPSSQENDFRPNLPYLTDKDKMILAAGGMIQKQHRDGYRCSGSVVVDIKCSPDMVFDTLTQIAMYEYMIPIVKSSKIISSDGIDTVADFTLTRLLLRANVKHTVLQNQRIVKFMLLPFDNKLSTDNPRTTTLVPSSGVLANPDRVNLVLQEAEGFWHVQVPTERPEGYCRVYLSAQVVTNTMIPSLILDYSVARALSRATKWLKPYFIKI